jgi:hypothetical protein
MAKLAELRSKAKALVLRGYSRLTKAQLVAALTPCVVYRVDRALVKKLGKQLLRACKVADWMKKGRGDSRRWLPRAWQVPAGFLQGRTPLSEAQADAIRDKRSEAGRKAAATLQDRIDKVAEEIGALPGSRTAREFYLGHIDEDEARLRAFNAEYRHLHTSYDDLLEAGVDRDSARAVMQEEPCPATWGEYLETYLFDGPVAEAMARVLKDPREAHPRWFKKAMMAVERAHLDLDNLTYEAIREAIAALWR